MVAPVKGELCSPKLIDIDFLKKVLDYDPDTGVFTWKHRPRELFKADGVFRSWNTRYVGTRAGCVFDSYSAPGYFRVKISLRKNAYTAHRLAWAYMTNEQPPEMLDHVDGDATNNQWKNIRSGAGGVNTRNMSMPRRNTTGITGVTWYKATSRWRASSRCNNRQVHLGYFSSKEEAESAVIEFRKLKGFSERHGSKRPDKGKH